MFRSTSPLEKRIKGLHIPHNFKQHFNAYLKVKLKGKHASIYEEKFVTGQLPRLLKVEGAIPHHRKTDVKQLMPYPFQSG